MTNAPPKLISSKATEEIPQKFNNELCHEIISDFITCLGGGAALETPDSDCPGCYHRKRTLGKIFLKLP